MAQAIGQRIGAEEPAAAFFEGAQVQAQAAAHRAGVVGGQVGVDEVGEVGDAVFCGDFSIKSSMTCPIQAAKFSFLFIAL